MPRQARREIMSARARASAGVWVGARVCVGESESACDVRTVPGTQFPHGLGLGLQAIPALVELRLQPLDALLLLLPRVTLFKKPLTVQKASRKQVGKPCLLCLRAGQFGLQSIDFPH
jgi:hypothetical protein